MVALSRRVVTALTLGCGLSAMLTITQPGWAATDIGEGAQSLGAMPCVIGHRFEPGPIVGGHNRQPTPAEFEALALPRRSDLQPPPSLCGRGQLSGHPAIVVAMMYPDGEKGEN